jgi:hypothetical protein
MTSTKGISTVAAGLLLVLVSIFGVACGSDDDDATTTSSRAPSGSTGEGTVNPEYDTWCTSVQNLVDQSSPGDLSDLGTLSAFNDAIQSLTTTAPEPILSDMQTIATATETKLQAVQVDPSATLPSDVAQQADTAQDEVALFVRDNCGGLQLPELDL